VEAQYPQSTLAPHVSQLLICGHSQPCFAHDICIWITAMNNNISAYLIVAWVDIICVVRE
jgi:hypothetical protein